MYIYLCVVYKFASNVHGGSWRTTSAAEPPTRAAGATGGFVRQQASYASWVSYAASAREGSLQRLFSTTGRAVFDLAFAAHTFVCTTRGNLSCHSVSKIDLREVLPSCRCTQRIIKEKKGLHWCKPSIFLLRSSSSKSNMSVVGVFGQLLAWADMGFGVVCSESFVGDRWRWSRSRWIEVE